MELIKFNDYIKKYQDPLVVTIGSFDGIHLGHQELIKKTMQIAKRLKHKSAVITFDPHPLTVISNTNHLNITTINEKASLISKLGIDYLIIINFDKDFAGISKQEFIDKYLKSINVVEVVVGTDFKFGYKGEGKPIDISVLSLNTINTTIIDLVKHNCEKIGSSKIINLLKNGDVEEANKLLGYSYSFSGTVVKGRQIGRKLGFPTANIDNYYVKKILKKGVYGVIVSYMENNYLGMMNVGNNPTCNYQEDISIEINLFDCEIDLYDKLLKIDCFCYVREEMKFNNSKELISQINIDKQIIINKNLMLAKK